MGFNSGFKGLILSGTVAVIDLYVFERNFAYFI